MVHLLFLRACISLNIYSNYTYNRKIERSWNKVYIGLIYNVIFDRELSNTNIKLLKKFITFLSNGQFVMFVNIYLLLYVLT